MTFLNPSFSAVSALPADGQGTRENGVYACMHACLTPKTHGCLTAKLPRVFVGRISYEHGDKSVTSILYTVYTDHPTTCTHPHRSPSGASVDSTSGSFVPVLRYSPGSQQMGVCHQAETHVARACQNKTRKYGWMMSGECHLHSLHRFLHAITRQQPQFSRNFFAAVLPCRAEEEYHVAYLP